MAGLPYGQHHQRLMQEFVKYGYTPEQAAGVVGNAMQESGPSINPSIVNPGEQAFGAFQWRLDRRQQLEALARERGLAASSLDAQIPHVFNELSGPYAAADKAMRQAQTPEEAAAIWDKMYERSAGAHVPERQKFARHVYNQYLQQAQQGSRLPAPGNPAASMATTGLDQSGVMPPPSPRPTNGDGGPTPMGPMAIQRPATSQGLLDQLAPSNGMLDFTANDMQSSSKAAAPMGASLMDEESANGPSRLGTHLGAGFASLGEALSASYGNRRPDFTPAAQIIENYQENKKEISEREGWIQLFNDDGMPELARAVVNGAPLEAVKERYKMEMEARAPGKPTDDMRELEHFRQLVVSGDPLANAFGAKVGLIDREGRLKEERLAEFMAGISEEQRQQMRDWGIVGSPTTEVNITENARSAGAEELAKLEADMVRTARDAIPNHRESLSKYRQMEALLDTGMNTGRLSSMVQPLKEFAADLGVDVGYATEAAEVFGAMAVSEIPKALEDLSGAHSDREMDVIGGSVPSLAKTEMGNRVLLKTMQRAEEIRLMRNKELNTYFSKNKTLDGFEDHLEQIYTEKFGEDIDNRNMFPHYSPDALIEKVEKGELKHGDIYFIEYPDGSLQLDMFDTRTQGTR